MTWPTDAPDPPKRYLTTSVANMAYHIEFAEREARDLEALYVEKNATESQAASPWCNGLEEAIYALASYPHPCPAAPEARNLRRELRHLLYGKKPHVYRVIYEVDELRQTVWGFTVRHGARGERLRRPILDEARNSSLRKYMEGVGLRLPKKTISLSEAISSTTPHSYFR